jgi:alpha-L-rhamnosidase
MVRWWWFGPAVEKPEILRELQQMKADGIGGAELAFVYPMVLDDPAKGLVNETFLSPEMLDNVRYAQTQGRKLGLRIDVTLASGWPYGGPHTTPEFAAHRIILSELPIPANSATIPAPAPSKDSTPIARFVGPGSPKHWDPATMKQLTSDLTPSSEPRVVLEFRDGRTGQQVKRAAVGAEGPVLDPFSQAAVANHLKSVGEPLLSAFADTPPTAIFSDSLEAYGADWTPALPAEFLKRRGYDLIPHLPELFSVSTPSTDAVKHDWGQTLTELVNQNYLTQINNWAIAHHAKFRSQTYGEPAVSFSSQHLVSLAEGEGPQWRAFSTLRWATSANHVFGQNVTSGETFTWLHSPVFRATPLDMKAEADIDFIMGENQLIFHGWPYSPPAGEVPEPGWSLYAAAVFNDHNPWHPVMSDVTRYIQRVSSLLRQGDPANQVAILLPTDDAWASFTPGKVTVTGALQKLITPELMSAVLSAGYNIDYIDADAINTIGLGNHQILVLPPTTRIPLDTLRKISDWAKHGGKVIALGNVPTLDASGKSSPELTQLASAIPIAPDEKELGKSLPDLAPPDLKMTGPDARSRENIGFIRRKLPDTDIYFVANTSNQRLDVFANFASNFKEGVAIDPDSAAVSDAVPTNQSLVLDPYESRVYIFANNLPRNPLVRADVDSFSLPDLSSNWQVNFVSANKTVPEPKLTSWTADPATLHYSGEAVYSRDFTLATLPTKGSLYLEVTGGMPVSGGTNSPPEHAALGANGLPDPGVTRTGPGMHAYYDPPIHEAAIVTVNGKPAGALWHPPYRLDVTHLLKNGQNHLEIHVYNTALNAWSALPPYDYKPLIEKYGDRFQMQDLDKVEPIPSGIIGQVYLVTDESR